MALPRVPVGGIGGFWGPRAPNTLEQAVKAWERRLALVASVEAHPECYSADELFRAWDLERHAFRWVSLLQGDARQAG